MADSEFIEQLKIQSLFTRCMYYRDCHQWEKVLETYHPDTSKTLCELSWIRGTVVDWVEGCKKIAAAPHTASHHVIHPIEAVINGDRALCFSTADMTVRATIEGVEVDITSFVRFVNRVVRTTVPGNRKEWRILTFQPTYVSDNISKTGLGSGSKELTVQVDDKARPTYKHLEWVLSRRGVQVGRDLPGVDVPESAEQVVKAAEAWLRESDQE